MNKYIFIAGAVAIVILGTLYKFERDDRITAETNYAEAVSINERNVAELQAYKDNFDNLSSSISSLLSDKDELDNIYRRISRSTTELINVSESFKEWAYSPIPPDARRLFNSSISDGVQSNTE